MYFFVSDIFMIYAIIIVTKLWIIQRGNIILISIVMMRMSVENSSIERIRYRMLLIKMNLGVFSRLFVNPKTTCLYLRWSVNYHLTNSFKNINTCITVMVVKCFLCVFVHVREGTCLVVCTLTDIWNFLVHVRGGTCLVVYSLTDIWNVLITLYIHTPFLE